MAPRTRNLNVVVGADVKPLKRDLDAGAKSVDKFGKSTEEAGKRAHRGFSLISPATTAAAVGIGGVGVALKTVISAAKDSEASNARMAAQLKASGISYRNHAKEIDNVIQKTSRLAALDDEDLQDAFTNIVRSTGKVSESLKLTGLAADLARAKHIDVAKAGQLVGKVATGNVTALSRYGIQIDKNATSQEALAKLQKTFAGQAEAYGKTAAGAQERFGVAVENLEEKLGTALLPTVTKVADKAAKFVEGMNNGTGAGGRFAAKVTDIAHAIEPVAKDFGTAVAAVAKFTSKHPDIVKVGTAVLGVGIALKTLKFASAATGFTDLVKAGRSASSTLVKVLGRAGSQGGAAASANAAETLAGNIDGSVNARKGKIRSALSTIFKGAGQSAGATASANAAETAANNIDGSLTARKGKFSVAGRGIGRVLGSAIAPVAIAIAGAELANWLSKLNDDLSKKGGVEGLLGKVSNAGEWIATHLGGPVGDVGRAVTKKAMGGRIPGAPVAADTVPALLSPQEFVVTGDGERTLEAMTFPGVLDWLQGAQAPHFMSGGRVADVARQAGFKGSALVRAIAIAHRESRFNEHAKNLKPPDHSIGLWQINQLAHHGRFGTDAQLENPSTNARAAWVLSQHGTNWSPWSTNKGLSEADLKLGRRLAGGGSGGSSVTRTGLSNQDYVFAGFQAAAEGTSLRTFLQPALDNVGEAHRLKDTPQRATGVSGAPAGAPPQVRAMLARAARYAGGPYDYGGGHSGFGVRGSKGGFDCSGYVSAILGPGVLRSPMAVVQPMASALQSGDGEFVTVGMRGTSGKGAHTMIRIGNQYFESGGGHGAAKVGGWNGSFQHYHPKGLRGGGRVRRMFGGGFAGRRNTGVVRTGRPGRSSSGVNISSLLDTIASGGPTAVKAALRKAQTLMAATGTVSSITAWIAAARRRLSAKGTSVSGRRGLQSFIDVLASAELGRQLENPLEPGVAAEGAFDQSMTDLGNQLAANRASEADTAGAQGALATQQLNTLYANWQAISGQILKARRSGSKKTIAELQNRLSATDSAILAKRAEIVGYQDQYTSALQGDGSGNDLQSSIDNLAATIAAHDQSIKDNNALVQQQLAFANAVQNSSASQLARTLADLVSGQIAAGLTQRRMTAGVGTVASY